MDRYMPQCKERDLTNERVADRILSAYLCSFCHGTRADKAQAAIMIPHLTGQGAFKFMRLLRCMFTTRWKQLSWKWACQQEVNLSAQNVRVRRK